MGREISYKSCPARVLLHLIYLAFIQPTYLVRLEKFEVMIKMTLNKNRQNSDVYDQVLKDRLSEITAQKQIQEQIVLEEARANRTRQNIGIIVLSLDQLPW